MNKIQEEFLEELTEWKENNWVLFAAQSTKRNTKRLWCNLNGQYKITLSPIKKPQYQGDNVAEALKIYYAL